MLEDIVDIKLSTAIENMKQRNMISLEDHLKKYIEGLNT